jgi:hypothetical protein
MPFAAFVVVRGIIPAFTEISSDFPNYYTSGMIARTGNQVERLYDDVWFQRQIDSLGIRQQGKFSPFPPPTVLPFIPLSYLKPLTALRVVTLLNLILVAASVILVSRLFSFSRAESLLFILLSGWGLVNCFRLGQLYIALSLSMLLGFYFYRQNRPLLAGISYAVLLPIKYFPLLAIVPSIWRRERQLMLGSFVTVACICLVSVLVLGWPVHETFVRAVLGEHLQGNLTQQNPFSPAFQSFTSLFRRMFVFDEKLNPQPFIASYGLFSFLRIVCTLFPTLLVAFVLNRLKKNAHVDAGALSIALLCLLGLLIAPATATYHFVLLWLPVGILLHHFRAFKRNTRFALTAFLYAAIGFLPYSFFHQFDGEGFLTLIAYPRLFLMGALFTMAWFAALNFSSRKLKNSEYCHEL